MRKVACSISSNSETKSAADLRKKDVNKSSYENRSNDDNNICSGSSNSIQTAGALAQRIKILFIITLYSWLLNSWKTCASICLSVRPSAWLSACLSDHQWILDTSNNRSSCYFHAEKMTTKETEWLVNV